MINIGRCNHIQTPTGARTCVTTQEKNLKKRPVPRRLSNSLVMCKSLKLYDVSFICDHSITEVFRKQVRVMKV